MIPQNVPDLIAEHNRTKMLLAAKEGECEVLKARVEALQGNIEAFRIDCRVWSANQKADAKRWETLCRMMRHAPGFGWELHQWIKPDGEPDELTPEALKAWLDKEAE